MKKEWLLKNDGDVKGSLIEKLLISRGISTPEEIKNFLNPLEMVLTSPNVFTDMGKAVERLSRAIDNNESILIYGDFDADGVTSTSVLYKTFNYLGGNVNFSIPSRESHGHGLNSTLLTNVILKFKPKVIITVDCGISNVREVSNIKTYGIDVIITDHHEAPEVLPSAYAIINPKAPYSLDENLSAKQIEHLTYLAGCGVALKVAQALLAHYGKGAFVNELLPLVAVGTIADIVPLLGENRYFVTKGLDLISQGKHEGLNLLLKSAKYDIKKGITAENIAFGVAPRINASGRLEKADDNEKADNGENAVNAVNVLISDSPIKLNVAVKFLELLNSSRQGLCDYTFKQAEEMYLKEGTKSPAIILYHPEWEVGIIGIVASKFVEKYYKPTFLMTKKEGVYRCSARSIDGVPLYDVISENSELLDGFGGHKLAAGLSFSEDKSSFELVKKALNETVSHYVAGRDLKPFLNIDLKLEAPDITLDLVNHLSKLEPFGANNPSPIFETDGFVVAEKRLMGDGKHLKLTVSKDGYTFPAILWGRGDLPLGVGDKLDLAFHPQKNEYNGNVSLQLIVDDIHSDKLPDETDEKLKIFDCRQKPDFLNEENDYLKNTNEKVGVFAECKAVLDSIKPYCAINSRTFTRENVPECDSVMFFDYPSDRATFEYILKTAKPKSLYFMNFEPKNFDEVSLLATFNGMIKYAINNYGGKVEYVRCASSLGKSLEVVKSLFDLFAEFGCIEISQKTDSFCVICAKNSDNVSKILNSEKYEQIFELARECDIFRQSLLEDDLEQIIYAE